MEIARFEVEYRQNYARWRVQAGENIAYWRQQRGLKQWAVAQALHLSQPTISRIERGTGYLPYDRLCAFATYLQVTPDDLVWTGTPLTPRPAG